MKHILRGFGLLLLVLTQACTDTHRHTSTEIENEITSTTLQGVAATGKALALTTVELFNPQGTLVGQTQTDSGGFFTWNAPLGMLTAQDLPLLLRLQKDSLWLAALVYRGENQINDTLFALVNPLTGLLVRQLLGTEVIHTPALGFTAPPADSLQVRGTRVIRQILGEEVSWEEFSNDRDFRPYAPLRPHQQPSANDALLHVLTDRAEELGLSLDYYLDSLGALAFVRYMQQQEFRIALAGTLAILGVSPEEALRAMALWGPGPLNEGDQESYYLALHQVREQDDDYSDSLLYYYHRPALEIMAESATDAALQQIPLELTGRPERPTAMAFLPNAAQITKFVVLQILRPLFEISPETVFPPNMQPLVEVIAQQSVSIMLTANPEKWSLQQELLRDLVLEVVRDSVVGDFDVEALAQDTTGNYFQQNYQPWIPSNLAELTAILRREAAEE